MIAEKNLAPQIIKPQIAYLLADMMADVIRRGTGVRARSLNRDDIAGKTGTTSDFHDAWFNGFNGDSSPRSGPASIRTARSAKAKKALMSRSPPGPTSCTRRWPASKARGARPRRHRHRSHFPRTGLLASSDNPNGIMEKFVEGNLPKSESYEGPNQSNPNVGDKPLF